MARILVIVGNYYPNPSSVVVVADPLIRELSRRGHDIEVLTDRSYPNLPLTEEMGAIRVLRVDDHRLLTWKKANAFAVTSTGKASRLRNMIAFTWKAASHLRHSILTKEMVTGGWDRKASISIALERDQDNPFDAIISYSQPYISHYLAQSIIARMKHPVRWFMHYYDPFSENRSGVKTPWKRALIGRDEQAMLTQCDVAFMTPELLEYTRKTRFGKFEKKIFPIEFASLTDCTKESSDDDQGPVRCFFAGTFYSGIRNPNYLLDVFSHIGEELHLLLMTDYFTSNRQSLPANTIVVPTRPRDEMWRVLDDSHVLVNVGNTVQYQVPGKIFEYFGTGKPIVHLAKIPNDPCLVYLKRYPLALVIEEWRGDVEGDARQIRDFCLAHRKESLDFSTISASMPTWVSQSVCSRYAGKIESVLDRP